ALPVGCRPRERDGGWLWKIELVAGEELAAGTDFRDGSRSVEYEHARPAWRLGQNDVSRILQLAVGPQRLDLQLLGVAAAANHRLGNVQKLVRLRAAARNQLIIAPLGCGPLRQS